MWEYSLVAFFKGHLVSQFDLVFWWGTSFHGPGHSNRCSHLISSFLAWSCSSLDHSSRPLRFNSYKIQSFWGHRQTLPRLPLEEPLVAPGWLEWSYQWPPWWGLQWGRHSGSSNKMALERSLSVTLHMLWSVQWKWAVGAPCWLGKHMDPYTLPSDICLAMNIDGPKWKNGDAPCGTDMPLDIVQREFLGCSRVRSCRGSDPLCSIPIPLVPLQGSWSNPDITAPKWAYFQVMVSLTSSPFMIIPIALSIILDPTMTGTFLE